MTSIYPIHLNAQDCGNYVNTHPLTHKMMRFRPKELFWYCADLAIHEDELSLSIRDTKQGMYRGIGPVVATIRIARDKLNEDELNEILKIEKEEMLRIAAVEYNDRVEAAKLKAIMGIARELFPDFDNVATAPLNNG